VVIFPARIVPVMLVLSNLGVAEARGSSEAGDLERPGPCWKLVASSDAIVQGRLVSHEGAGSAGTSTVTLDADRWLKGAGQSGRISVVNRVGDSLPTGRPVIAFLQWFAPGSPYYLTEHREVSCPSLRDASEPSATVEDEIARQGRLRAAFAAIATRTRATPQYKPVRREVEALVRARPETKARRFRSLIHRGWDAVPAMIVLLDDDRDVPRGSIEVSVRAPNAFESVAHYEPRTVFEVLDLVLSEITDVSFGMPFGEEVVHDRVVGGWRAFLGYGCPRTTAVR
jgi:hypothetical protein